MIKIQCTGKLTEKFDIKMKNDIICDDLFSWHAHIFSFNRRNCIIFMNNKTRYNFIMYGVIKKQIYNFNSIIKENLIAVPLEQLNPIDVDSDSEEAVNDWKYWVERGYEF
ncbi:MAG: calcium-binding protein [Clostridiales bacterium]